MTQAFGPSLEVGQEFLIGGTMGETIHISTVSIEGRQLAVFEGNAIVGGLMEMEKSTVRTLRDIADNILATFDAEELRDTEEVTPADLL